MRQLRNWLLLSTLVALLVWGLGCASSGGRRSSGSDSYYGRGSKHSDSFPGAYGGYYGYGRPGSYRY